MPGIATPNPAAPAPAPAAAETPPAAPEAPAPAPGTPSLDTTSREVALAKAVEIMSKGLKPAAAPAVAPGEADPEDSGKPLAKPGMKALGQPGDDDEEGDEEAPAGDPEDEESPDATAGEEEQDEEEKPAEPKLARGFAVLAKREAAIVQRESKLKQRESELDAFEAARRDAHANPVAVLEALGITVNDLNEFVINGKKPTPEMQQRRVDEELKRLEAEQKKWKAEQAAERAREQMEQLKGRISSSVASDVEAFELINAQGEQDLVFDVIIEHAKANNGAWLGGSEKEAIRLAASQVEAYLEEQGKRLLQSKKLSGKVGSEVTKRAVPGHERTGPQKKQPRTLTNGHAALPARKQPETMTEEERLAAATAAIRFR
jgi:hypothetical protein